MVFAILFVPLERVFRARPRVGRRPELLLDILFYFFQYAIWAGAVSWLLMSLEVLVEPVLAPRRGLIDALPWAAKFVIAWFAGDLVLYWGHRLQHRVPLLWRFHRVHHTAEEVDWLASFREHPVDGLYTRLLANLPTILIGFSLAEIAGLMTLRGLWASFIHANVRLAHRSAQVPVRRAAAPSLAPRDRERGPLQLRQPDAADGRHLRHVP